MNLFADSIPAAPHGIAALAGKPVVHAPRMLLEIADACVDFLRRMGIGRLHALQAPDDPMHFPPKEPCQSGLTALPLLLGMRPILQRGDLRHMLTAVVVVQNL